MIDAGPALQIRLLRGLALIALLVGDSIDGKLQQEAAPVRDERCVGVPVIK